MTNPPPSNGDHVTQPDQPAAAPTVNGTRPQPPAQDAAAALAEMVFANYNAFARKLDAINLFLAELPLEAMLQACRRHQTTSVLLLPAQVGADEARAAAEHMRHVEKVIQAALALQRLAAGG